MKEVARRLAVSRAHVYRLVKEGYLPTVRVGARAVRVREEALEAFLKANEAAAHVYIEKTP